MIINNMPDTEYHAHPYIGSTTAKLALRSPQLFVDAITGVYKRKDSPALKVGRLAHMAVLEPDRFANQVRDVGPINPKTGAAYGRDTKAWQEWEAANPGVIVVEPWIRYGMDRMPDDVADLFREGGHAEQSVFRDCPALGGGIKCRPDYRIGKMMVDLKTTLDVDRCERDIARFQYWFSHAWYRQVMRDETGETHFFSFVFMEKNTPYRWRIVDMDPDYAMYADDQVRRAMDIIAEGVATGRWLDPAEVRIIASRPDYLDDSTDSDDEE